MNVDSERRNGSDGRAEELPEDARPSGSQTDEGSGGMSQTGGPRNYQKMPARLAARQEGSGGMSRTGGPRNYQKMPARLTTKEGAKNKITSNKKKKKKNH